MLTFKTQSLREPQLGLMATMARPKPLAVRREQLAQLHDRLQYGSLLNLSLWVFLLVAIHPHASPTALLSTALTGLLLTGLMALFGRLIPPRIQPDSRFLPRNIAFLNLVFVLLMSGQLLVGGLIAGLVSSASPLETVLLLMPIHFGASTLLAFLLGVWLTPFLLLLAMPLLWTLTWALTTSADLSLDFWSQVTIVALTHYALATLWFVHTHQQRLSHLQMEGVMEYLSNARQASEQFNRQLAQEIAQREQVERQLRDLQRQLERELRERRQELLETTEALGQQTKLRKNISDALVKSQSRLAQAIEAAELSLWDWDIEAGSVYQSFFHRAFGAREMSLADYRQLLRDIVPQEHWPAMKEAMVRCLKGQTATYRVQYPVRLAEGQLLWVEDCGKPVAYDPETGRVTRMLGTRRDITLERQKNEQLLLAKSVFDHTNDGIFALDDQLRFLTVNRAFTQITGYAAEDVLGRTLIEISSTPQKEQVFQRIQESLITDGHWQGELYEKRKQGDYFVQWLQLKAITNAAGRITHYAGLFLDMTERKVTDEKLHYLLHYDDLTGLANRVLFRDRLHNLLSRLRADHGGAALLIIDIDRFRQVNESLGHDQGDELLKQVALRISRVSQEADTVARLGNDEFAVILPTSQRGDVVRYCESLQDELRAHFNLAGQEFFVSASIGITLAPDQGREIHGLMQQAHMAVRQAKYLGGNTHEFYSKTLQSLTSKRLDIETELRRALQRDQLEVYYQPQYSLIENRITSVEALVRWAHPEKGLIAPMEFVPVAEESGLIAAIGERVLMKACQQSAEWQRAGLGSIGVSVNVSAFQLRQNNLIPLVRTALRETGLDPSLLDLELTESALMENLARTTFTLTRLREMGIQVTIDDFGTGYSSLAYLKRFPISALKIDRVFVKDIPANPDDVAITRAILLLGQSLNLAVIAEGVETQEQLDFLRGLNCHLVQGYFIARPLKSIAVSELLKLQRSHPESALTPS